MTATVANEPAMTVAFLGLGSNLGDRLANFRSAARAIVNQPDIQSDPNVDFASLYETSPVGVTDRQNDFLNTVICTRTSLSPRELLGVIQAIESSLGRIRRTPGESRSIDLDILLYGDLVVSESDLIIPHPRLHERLFVLVPLTELAPDLRHPGIGTRIGDLVEHLAKIAHDQQMAVHMGPEWFFPTVRIVQP